MPQSPETISQKISSNLLEVVKILKKEQAAIEVTIEQLASGGRARGKRRKVVQQEETTKRLTTVTEFTEGDKCF